MQRYTKFIYLQIYLSHIRQKFLLIFGMLIIISYLFCPHYVTDVFLHLSILGFNALEQPELRLGPCEIVLRILYLVICVAVEVVSEEPYALHIREQGCGVWQVLYLYGQQEGPSGFQISFCECPENIQVEIHVVQFPVILRRKSP